MDTQVGPATSATPALATSPSASLSPKTLITWRCPVAVNIARRTRSIYSPLMLLLIGPLDLWPPRPKPSSDPCSHQFALFALFSPPCIRSIEPLICIRDKSPIWYYSLPHEQTWVIRRVCERNTEALDTFQNHRTSQVNSLEFWFRFRATRKDTCIPRYLFAHLHSTKYIGKL